MSYLEFFLKSLIYLFVIVDPIGNIPLYITFTEHLKEEEREAVSKRACLVASSILVLISLTGKPVLDFFHVTVDSIRIAGGILLFIVSIDILFGRLGRERYLSALGDGGDSESLAVFPIALPLYTGPGAITAVLALVSEADDPLAKLIVVFTIALIYLIVRLTHIYSEALIKFLGRVGANIVARVMAIFLAAMAVEFAWNGIEGKLKSLKLGD